MTIEAYHRPATIADALELSAEYTASLQVISGGTLAMPKINDGHTFPTRVMDLRGLGLDYIESSDGEHLLGATLTLTQLLNESQVPLLQEAARHTGGWAVRNMGTVAGNLFAPPPLGDFAVALLALNAEIKIHRQAQERWLSVSAFYTGPNETALKDDELITELRVPSVEGKTAYLKFTRSQEPAPAVVTVAVNLIRQDESVEEIRLALNGAGPYPRRMQDAEEILQSSILDDKTIEHAANAAAEAADPPEDAIASVWYRRRMIREYVSRALYQIRDEENSS